MDNKKKNLDLDSVVRLSLQALRYYMHCKTNQLYINANYLYKKSQNFLLNSLAKKLGNLLDFLKVEWEQIFARNFLFYIDSFDTQEDM